MEVTIEAMSYVHVGSGTEERVGLPSPEELELSVKTRGFEQAAHELSTSARVWTGHAAFASAGGKPCIPGSSVKGNIRSRIELSLVSRNGLSRSCFIRASQPSLAQSPRAWRHRKIWGAALSEDRGPPCDLTRRGDGVCLLCDLFGTAGLRGLVTFSDFVGEDVTLERIMTRHGLRLMAAPVGSKFRGLVGFSNLRLYEVGLLLHGMGLIDSPRGRIVMLGRLKYVGEIGGKTLGKVIYSVNALKASTLSEPQPNLTPGEKIEGKELEDVVRDALSAAKKEFGEELRVVEEVVKR